MELYRKYRPTSLDDMIGQPSAVKVLKQFIKKGTLPHALLFTGPSGCGKTTGARILQVMLKCIKEDYKEVNAGSKGGIDLVRSIQDTIGATSFGPAKMIVIDEAHELTRPAQEGLLKTLEDCPSHAYIILATTNPDDLINTIKTRCTEIRFSSINDKDLCAILAKIVEKETDSKNYPPDEVLEAIADASDGSARMAINILGRVLNLKTVEEQLDAIQKANVKHQTFDLVKLLLGWGTGGRTAKWKDVVKILDAVKGEDVEVIRRTILSCLVKEVRKGGDAAKRAHAMYNVFQYNFYDTKYPGLVFACYSVCKD